MAEADPRIVAGQTIIPQAGPQTTFLSSPADIAIYGGAAGGGKTWALLMEPLRHVHNPGFGAVTFRRSTVQIRNEGGLWDESAVLYPQMGADPKEHVLSWSFPSGASCSFAHLEHDKTRFNWQGSQIPLINFDELTHFTPTQFWYMVSRNRSMCGVRPYIRATCNPDADSWVADLISWWIDQDTGQAIPERAGKLRWFVRVGEDLRWADAPAELEQYTMLNENGEQVPIPAKSLTFIPAKLTDNKALMAADPGYMASLLALPMVERERLLGGNWKIRPAAGLYFQRSWCRVVDAVPAGTVWGRGWDLAATTPSPENPDPDYLAGVLIGRTPDDRYIVTDSRTDRTSPAGMERFILNTASYDGYQVEISLPQDPGSAGKTQVATLAKMLSGYIVRSSTETGDKVTRFGPFSAQAEAGNVDVLRGPWNEGWFANLEGFPVAKHDDEADATSRAFEIVSLAQSGGWFMTR
ncbi:MULTISPECIES: phage terminase large subunit [unclassified Sphingomonas]|uniref:phage terminase large subunit n=1 Tax=unclassified Sphingomonas TaxID=196159 RepID=UPI0025D66D7E|nr:MULTISPECIES: phage terminase large subunit [unclassified Sphingomonas]